MSKETARELAYEALMRIDLDGAYANLVVPRMLDRSQLSDIDRRFVTDLVYGTTRMRRACDVVIDSFVSQPPDPPTRNLLRLGAYQLVFLGVAPHAGVGETVELAPRRTRGFVNAVLRKVSRTTLEQTRFPSDTARLSYPEWIGQRLVDELGSADAMAAMERMNIAPTVYRRDDGYVQDESSLWVAAAMEAGPGDVIADVCASPGGKATAMAATGAFVLAADVRESRISLIQDNVARLGSDVAIYAADGAQPPISDGSLDGVLVDAPCSGLGTLRRRADARWRIDARDIDDLVHVQAAILAASARLVKPGGRLGYSVCTLTSAESIDHMTPDGFDIVTDPPPVGSWRPYEHGWRVLPQDADTDGMTLIRFRRRG